MTVLEQWKQLAARENAAMRANLGYASFNKPKPTRTAGKPIDATERQQQIIAAISEKPGQHRAYYMERLQFSEARWKKAISGLLSSRTVRICRRSDGTGVTYHLWSEE